MKDLILKAENYIFKLFKDKLSCDYTYHNFLHTQFVVNKLSELLRNEPVSLEDQEALILAAWFHDAGYTSCEQGHEEKSASIAEEFLQENHVDHAKIQQVKELIFATRLGHEPQNDLEKIIKDADSAHLGDPSFEEISAQLRRECELIHHEEISDAEWNKMNYAFLVLEHRFYTQYAKDNWQSIKLKHVVNVQENIRNQKELEQKALLKENRIKKINQPDRGIDTLFRVTLNNHTRLSDIADSKANILLSVNAIIISIALSTLVPKLAAAKNEYLIIPTLTMLLVSVVCIIFAILATKPNVSNTNFSFDEIKKNKVNLLFFGNFHKIDVDDFERAINDLMSDREDLYNALTRDLYYLGLVLQRKYRLLRITYYVFMIGIVLTVLAFVISFSNEADLSLLFD